MKDKHGVGINIGDSVAIIGIIGYVTVSGIDEERDSISYIDSRGVVRESSSDISARGFICLCDSIDVSRTQFKHK